MKKKYLTYFLIFIICAMASGALTYSILHLMKAHQDYEDSRDVYEELEDDFIEHPDTQNWKMTLSNIQTLRTKVSRIQTTGNMNICR